MIIIKRVVGLLRLLGRICPISCRQLVLLSIINIKEYKKNKIKNNKNNYINNTKNKPNNRDRKQLNKDNNNNN